MKNILLSFLKAFRALYADVPEIDHELYDDFFYQNEWIEE